MAFYEVRISKKRGGKPFKVVSVENILVNLYECSSFTDGGFIKTRNFVMKKCAFCKKDFKAVHQRMKYCVKDNVLLKDQCRSKEEARKKLVQRALLPLSNCALCKKEFQPVRDRHTLCNKPCNSGMVRRNVNRKKVYKCKWCKKEYSTNKKNAFVYCGEPCSYPLFQLETAKQKTLERHKNQKCKVCSKIIVGAKRPRIVCHDPCYLTPSVKKMLRRREQAIAGLM